MLSYLNYDTTNSDEVEYGTCYYDDDGHCSDSLYDLIVAFWKDFDSDKKFKYVVSGEYDSDELDLEGGRDYLLTRSDVMPLLFDYMTNCIYHMNFFYFLIYIKKYEPKRYIIQTFFVYLKNKL